MQNIIIRKGSIVTADVDAIIIPANSTGAMPGGVAGAIKLVAGNEVEEDAIAQAPIHIGSAILTTAETLPARNLIHAPVMEHAGAKTNEDYIRSAMEAALDLAEDNNFLSVAIPGMGTGTGGVSPKISAKIMIQIIKAHPKILEIILVDISDDMVSAWKSAIKIYK
ncbi:MAG: macro domain-containing protein [Nanoarchaeota archaeon]